MSKQLDALASKIEANKAKFLKLQAKGTKISKALNSVAQTLSELEDSYKTELEKDTEIISKENVGELKL